VRTELPLRGCGLVAELDRTNLVDGRLRLWWLGQSGFLLQCDGIRLLIDPYLSDSLATKYAGTSTPHERMTERPVEPSQLSNIHCVCVTHHHTDHADPWTLDPLLQNNPWAALILPAASQAYITGRLATRPNGLIAMDAEDSFAGAGFSVLAIPAAHENIELDEAGRCRYLGYLIRLGSCHIFHSGDTVWDEQVLKAVSPHEIDLALLPINGRGKGVAGNLDAAEAAEMARRIGAGWTIPCHYGMFAFNSGSVEDFRCHAEKLALQFATPVCGTLWAYPEAPPAATPKL